MHTPADKVKYRNNALQFVLDRLKIRSWDYVMIGDGSGTTRERACGWGCTVIAKDGQRQYYGGRMNYGGSNIVAETMAYTHPLIDLSHQHKTKAGDAGKALRIHIITDCQHVADAGNNPALRRSHLVLWAPVEAAMRRGIFTQWHWWGRDEIRLNQLAHELANAQRKAADDIEELRIALAKVLKRAPENVSLEQCTRYRAE